MKFTEPGKTYNCAWDIEKISKDWKNGIIVKFPKKGDLSDCNS